MFLFPQFLSPTNVSQFLPQDRVAEFAKLEPWQVLIETEKATGGKEMHEQHLKLVSYKKREKDMKTVGYSRSLVQFFLF